MKPKDVVEPLLTSDKDVPPEVKLPGVRMLRFIGRFMLVAAERRKQRALGSFFARRAKPVSR